ncbi:MAG: hypothetical protein KatS3mg111_1603 [Pirellulaceae bacterium]|nr:MAG: hypothetical protein KatS3mg111_1603 [Pirellulaceae bacterium]
MCEPRLVLSAQLLFDVLGDIAIDHAIVPDDASGQPPIQWHLTEAHQATGWNAVASRFGLDGRGQTVAVIDSGIAYDHQALGGGFGPHHRVVGGWDFAENDADPYDDAPAGFHGTHVAGIIGSTDPTHHGVAPGTDLVALRVFNDMGQGQLSWVESALRWVHENRNAFVHPITTVNLSLGTNWNSDTIPAWANLEDEFQLLAADGILVTASAGNSFSQYQTAGVSYPAASPYVLPVASLDEDGSLSDFSQRSPRVLAAPGTSIVSTVPDGFFGRDGVANDFAAASGTSMAAPYVAGASVLLRQAMEMVGWESISPQSIISHLHQTAGSIYDPVTATSYDTLDLQAAINAILPDDTVADTLAQATTIGDFPTSLDTWINHLGDRDAYRFTPSVSGQLMIDADSEWAEGLNWTLYSNDHGLIGSSDNSQPIALTAGQSYTLVVTANTIGPATIDLEYAPAESSSATEMPSVPAIDLGAIDFQDLSLQAGQVYAVTATRSGMMTIQWQDADPAGGSLMVRSGDQQLHTIGTWSADGLRWDGVVTAGERVEFFLPPSADSRGQLVVANLLELSSNSATLHGTSAGDAFRLDLQNSQATVQGITYRLEDLGISSLTLAGGMSNDRLEVVGSSQADVVNLRPTESDIASATLQISTREVEQVRFVGGGGPDRVYLYDSDTNDTLRIAPRQAELIGVGYRFDVLDVDRIFVHATGAGEDHAFFTDSPGNDRFSARPQFSSMQGDGYFNYVRGFERVYAYATAGGHDTVQFWDSPGDDRFLTSGTTASMVGPGFSSFSRGFDVVAAQAGSGGHDTAALYGSGDRTQWQEGSDFVSFREEGFLREARRFAEISLFVDGQLQRLTSAAGTSIDTAALIRSISSEPMAGGQSSSLAGTPTVDASLVPSHEEPGGEDAAAVPWDRVSHLPTTDLRPHPFMETAAWPTPSAWESSSVADGLPVPSLLAESSMSPGMEPGHHLPPSSPWLSTTTADGIADEWTVLGEVEEMRRWLEERFSLPEAPMMEDSRLERNVLHEAFEQLAHELTEHDNPLDQVGGIP